MDQQLEQCVGYFTGGGPYEWIVGGLFVVVLVVFSLTKNNFVSIAKLALGMLTRNKPTQSK